jgi:hypothetical protein
LATVGRNDLTEEEMALIYHGMVGKVDNKRIAPEKQSDLKPPSIYIVDLIVTGTTGTQSYNNI